MVQIYVYKCLLQSKLVSRSMHTYGVTMSVGGGTKVRHREVCCSIPISTPSLSQLSFILLTCLACGCLSTHTTAIWFTLHQCICGLHEPSINFNWFKSLPPTSLPESPPTATSLLSCSSSTGLPSNVVQSSLSNPSTTFSNSSVSYWALSLQIPTPGPRSSISTQLTLTCSHDPYKDPTPASGPLSSRTYTSNFTVSV